MLNVLVGAHGTGKTTLLQELRGISSRYYITDGFSRPIKEVANGRDINDQLEQELINELTLWGWNNYLGQNVVSGRSLIDTIVYSEFFYPLATFNRYRKEFQKSKKNVNYFYIPIEFELQKDGVRFEDSNEQVEIDRLLKLFLVKEELNFITLRGSVQERVRKLNENLK